MSRIYLDHAATSPLLPAVREAMLPWLDSGNASSLYSEGRAAKDVIDGTRETLSNALGCLFAEVLFTSGGTEAANLAIIGAALANPDPSRNRIVLGAAEHHCVLHTKPILERLGYHVDLAPVDKKARIDLSKLVIGEDVFLMSAMHANNELGTYNPIDEIRDRSRAVGAVLHVDAVQTFMVGDWKVDDLEADLITISAHKIGGPKGCGAICVRAGTSIKPLVGGGGQEREVRGGTENVAAIIGFGAAVEAAPPSSQQASRDAFEAILVAHGAQPSVERSLRLPGHCHVRFPGLGAETALIRLDRAGISASSGAACSSGSIEPSHVLLACGYSLAGAKEGLRFTLGRTDGGAFATEAANRVVDCLAPLIGG